MSEGLRLKLLGNVQIHLDGEPVDSLTSQKAQALLVFLVLNPNSHPRASLAALLWGDILEKSARANLRMALSHLRKSVNDYLSIDRQSAAFDPTHPHWIDVLEFESACAQKDLSKCSIEQLQEAIDLYRGDFLDNIYISDAPQFEEWVTLERERLRRIAAECLLTLIDRCLKTQRYSEGIESARRLLDLEPWREEGHRQLMVLLAYNGERSAALHQFQVCKQILAEELSVEPSSETFKLYEDIQSSDLPGIEMLASVPKPQVSPETTDIPNNLPIQTTPFVGRADELEQLRDLITKPDCRLITLIGPGGIGKTRLAIQAAAQIVENGSIFTDGVYFIPLTEANSETDLFSAIALPLEITFQSSADMLEQLKERLASQNILLLLDNFEQISASAAAISALLIASTGLKFVVTSRERLRLVEEWLFDVRGLPVPEAEKEIAIDELGRIPSVELFLNRARRVNLRFDLSTEAPGLIKICRQVEGMPLALELAAAWARSFSCAQIAGSIQKNIDFLSSDARNRPDRHLNLRAVFEYSWDLLEPVEQRTLSRTTVFSGGFTLEAAQVVAEASPRTIANLVDKSLVERAISGRYHLHPLVEYYSAEQLDEPINAVHAEHFMNILMENTESLRGSAPEKVIDELIPDIGNLRAAWQWFTEEGDAASISQFLLPFFEIYDARSWYMEGETLFAQTQAIFRDNEQLHARLASLRARFLTRLGQIRDAEVLLRDNLDILQNQDLREYGDALNNLNNILRRQGKYDEARQTLEKARYVYEEAGFSRGIASVLNNLGLASYRQGDYEEAASLQGQSVDLYRQTGPRKDLATVLNNLGLSNLVRGDYQAADSALAESASIAEEIDYYGCLVVATQNRGLVAMRANQHQLAEERLLRSLELSQELGMQDMGGHVHDDLAVFYNLTKNYQKARKHASESLFLGEQLGIQWLVASAHSNLAETALEEGKAEEMVMRLKAGMEIALSLKAESLILYMLTTWADDSDRRGDTDKAVEILLTVRPHLRDDPARMEKVESLLEILLPKIQDDQLGAVRNTADNRTPEELANELLALDG